MSWMDFRSISPAPSSATTHTQNTPTTTAAVYGGDACTMSAHGGVIPRTEENNSSDTHRHSYHQMEADQHQHQRNSNDSCENNNNFHSCRSCHCCDYYLHPSFCAKLFCWPCQCGAALTNAALQCDWSGCVKVLFCCPCRLFCDLYPTEAEELERNTYHKTSSGTPTLVRRTSNSSRHSSSSNPHSNRNSNDKDPYPEPNEIPFERVFEMEKKKRQVMGTSC